MLVEIVFGPELLESFVTTASASPDPAFGWVAPLNRHIPKGFVIDRFRSTLLSVLYYKHHLQYCMLDHTNLGTIISKGDCLDLTTARFAIRKSILHQVIYFRRVYFFLFLAGNLGLSLLTYLFSDSLSAAVVGFLAVHFGKASKT